MKRLWMIGIVILVLLTGCNLTKEEPETPDGYQGYSLSDESIDELYQYIREENLATLLNREGERCSVTRQIYDILINMGRTGIEIDCRNADTIAFEYSHMDYHNSLLEYEKDGIAKQAYLLMNKDEGELFIKIFTTSGAYQMWYDEKTAQLTGTSMNCQEESSCGLREEMNFVPDLQEKIIYEIEHYEDYILKGEEREQNIQILEDKLRLFINAHKDNIVRPYYIGQYSWNSDQFSIMVLPQTTLTDNKAYHMGEVEEKALRTLQVMAENEREFSVGEISVITKEMLKPLVYMTKRYGDCDEDMERPQKDYPYILTCRYRGENYMNPDVKEITNPTYDPVENNSTYIFREDLDEVARQVFGLPISDELLEDYWIGSEVYPEDYGEYSPMNRVFYFTSYSSNIKRSRERYLLLESVEQNGTEIRAKVLTYDLLSMDYAYFIIGRDGTTICMDEPDYMEKVLGIKDHLQQWEYVLRDEGNELYRIESGTKLN